MAFCDFSFVSFKIFCYRNFTNRMYFAMFFLLEPMTLYLKRDSDSPMISQYFFQQSIES